MFCHFTMNKWILHACFVQFIIDTSIFHFCFIQFTADEGIFHPYYANLTFPIGLNPSLYPQKKKWPLRLKVKKRVANSKQG